MPFCHEKSMIFNRFSIGKGFDLGKTEIEMVKLKILQI